MTNLIVYFVPVGKIMVLILQAIYILFAFMLTRQLKIMNHNFKTNLAGIFNLLALVHLIAAFAILILTYLSK
jgi:hypothetical protein